jgi:hypothetical protein
MSQELTEVISDIQASTDSIADSSAAVSESTEAIRTAIASKNVAIPDDAKLSTFADYIYGMLDLPQDTINALAAADTPSSSNPFITQTAFENLLTTKIPGTLVTDVSVGADTSTAISLDVALFQYSDGSSWTSSVYFPDVSPYSHGMATPEMYTQIENLTTIVEGMQNQQNRWAVTIPDNATSAILQFLWDSMVAETIRDGVILFDPATNATWQYYIGDDTWYPLGASNVALAVEGGAGLIIGATNTDLGKVFMELDGTGSVVGWTVLNNNVGDLLTRMDSIESAGADLTLRLENLETTGNEIYTLLIALSAEDLVTRTTALETLTDAQNLRIADLENTVALFPEIPESPGNEDYFLSGGTPPTWESLPDKVQTTRLLNYEGASSLVGADPVQDTDTVIGAIAKLQKQIDNGGDSGSSSPSDLPEWMVPITLYVADAIDLYGSYRVTPATLSMYDISICAHEVYLKAGTPRSPMSALYYYIGENKQIYAFRGNTLTTQDDSNSGYSRLYLVYPSRTQVPYGESISQGETQFYYDSRDKSFSGYGDASMLAMYKFTPDPVSAATLEAIKFATDSVPTQGTYPDSYINNWIWAPGLQLPGKRSTSGSNGETNARSTNRFMTLSDAALGIENLAWKTTGLFDSGDSYYSYPLNSYWSGQTYKTRVIGDATLLQGCAVDFVLPDGLTQDSYTYEFQVESAFFDSYTNFTELYIISTNYGNIYASNYAEDNVTFAGGWLRYKYGLGSASGGSGSGGSGGTLSPVENYSVMLDKDNGFYFYTGDLLFSAGSLESSFTVWCYSGSFEGGTILRTHGSSAGAEEPAATTIETINAGMSSSFSVNASDVTEFRLVLNGKFYNGSITSGYHQYVNVQVSPITNI